MNNPKYKERTTARTPKLMVLGNVPVEEPDIPSSLKLTTYSSSIHHPQPHGIPQADSHIQMERRVSAYCTASSYSYESLESYLSGEAQCALIRFDDCIYCRHLSEEYDWPREVFYMQYG